MKFVDVVVLLYALLTIVMGVLGYVAPGHHNPSIISLIAGVGVGALLLGALALTKTNPRAGRIAAAVLTLIPLGRFVPSFIKSGFTTWYPAGIMTVAGVLTFAVLLGGHFVAMSRRGREA